MVGEKQYISFVDPKGIRQLRSFEDAKIKLAEIIRTDIEPRLNDPNVILNSFIVSNTPISAVSHWAGFDQKAVLDIDDCNEFNKHHVYFQHEQSAVYISKILKAALNSDK